ncbi:MAG: thrombospondin type 3 repeat-containing protein, partial [Polyangiaceae bacterium]|nr:thrombospondin type 3 repeat-containing protein [Polyangiaceae bacterium]
MSQTLPALIPSQSECGGVGGGFLVGFGATSFGGSGSSTRTAAFSSGWHYVPFGGGSRGIYRNSWDWTTVLAGGYHGSLSGDSGGGLFPAWQPRLLCGVISRHYTETHVDPLDIFSSGSPAGYRVLSEVAALDTVAAQSFLRGSGVWDSLGRLKGYCDKGGGGVGVGEDIDTDGDQIPDACDPCPRLADPLYPVAGAYTLQFDTRLDRDGDGVNENELAVGGSGTGRAVNDADGDGAPDVCDSCPAIVNPYQAGVAGFDQPDADRDGLGDACDKCAIPDPVCCTTDAHCNPREPRGLRCRPTMAGLVSWVPAIGGGPPAPHPCAGGSMCEASVDSDDDGVGDLCDNCPRQSNPTQADDGDADGIGTACDTCPNLSDRAAPAVGLVSCTVAGPADSIAVSDLVCLAQTGNGTSACVRMGDGTGACSFGRDADGDAVGDACDNCKTTKNADQANCNVDIERTVGVPFPYVGDACDREPCSRIVVESTSLAASAADDTWAKLRLDPILLPPSAPGAYPVSGFIAPRVDIGLRACKCVLPPGPPPKPSPSTCQQFCPIEPSEFGVQGSNWTPVAVIPSTELSDPPAGTSFPASTFLPDSIYPARPLLPPTAPPTSPSFVDWDVSRFPGAATLGQTSSFCTAGYGVLGVLWTSAQKLTSIPAMNTVAALGHHYVGGVLGVPMKCAPPAPTAVAPCLICGDECATCSLKEMGYLTLKEMEEPGYDPPAYILGVDGAQRFVTEVDDDVRLARSAAGVVLVT